MVYVIDLPGKYVIELYWKDMSLFILNYESRDNSLTMRPLYYFKANDIHDEELPRMAAVLLSVMADKMGAVLSEASKDQFTQMLRVHDLSLGRRQLSPDELESLKRMFIDAHMYLLKRDTGYGKSMAPRPSSAQIHRRGFYI